MGLFDGGWGVVVVFTCWLLDLFNKVTLGLKNCSFCFFPSFFSILVGFVFIYFFVGDKLVVCLLFSSLRG